MNAVLINRGFFVCLKLYNGFKKSIKAGYVRSIYFSKARQASKLLAQLIESCFLNGHNVDSLFWV